jgi:hypothetical protein
MCCAVVVVRLNQKGSNQLNACSNASDAAMTQGFNRMVKVTLSLRLDWTSGLPTFIDYWLSLPSLFLDLT